MVTSCREPGPGAAPGEPTRPSETAATTAGASTAAPAPAELATCGSPIGPFPTSSLLAPAPADATIVAALRDAIPGLSDPVWALGQDADLELVAVGNAGPGQAALSNFEAFALRQAEGSWRVVFSGGCEPRAVVDGRPARAWAFAAAPGASATEVTVTVGECALDPWRVTPIVAQTPDAVVITITVAYADGDDVCRHPAAEVTVPLAEELAGRPVFDGATIPPTQR
ncbi:MAG: hypothetical protein GEV08_24180 [Acidimicrobiia bacterium]|nr:hypothetical protein [Acidimicrobiia bacterium]